MFLKNKKKALIESVNNGIIQPLWEDSRESGATDKKGYIFAKYRSALANSEVTEVARYNHDLYGAASLTLNIFIATARGVHKDEIVVVAKVGGNTELLTLSVLNSHSIAIDEFYCELADRCPTDQKSELFTILDTSDSFVNAMPDVSSSISSRFFAKISEGRLLNEAIIRLKNSRSWGVCKKDRSFVEYMDDRDSRLLAALE